MYHKQWLGEINEISFVITITIVRKNYLRNISQIIKRIKSKIIKISVKIYQSK